MTQGEAFWKEDPKILFEEKYITKFFPKQGTTLVEKLNASMRLIIYSSLLICLYTKKINYLVLPILFGIITIYVHENPQMFEKYLGSIVEGFDQNYVAFTGPPKILKDSKQPECIKPTLNNPFMNPIVTESSTLRDTPACDILDPEIKEDVNNKFKNNLFRDTSDLFGKLSSQRQFYTIPDNDTITFANWLYRNDEICKVDNNNCLRYEDVRANRRI
jgi:hypothetical protein